MPLTRIFSGSILGIEALLIEVEVNVILHQEKTSLVIVGLPDIAVKESKDRVSTAIKNSGYEAGYFHCTVNLAPGDLKKEGPLYDLPVALGLLHSLGVFQSHALSDYLVIGELALSGQTRPVKGAIAIAQLAKKMGKKGILISSDSAIEASAVPGIDVFAIAHLKDAVAFFKNPQAFEPVKFEENYQTKERVLVDFCEIKGQNHAKRALEIAAAGGHNLVLSGPPGTGKTMLAKALSGIMPELSIQEALEATRVHSIAGLLPQGQPLLQTRPFRSPHHTVSYAGLIGGGHSPRPGEVSLAHCGVLFLDELPEFSRSVLEVLRQPLEDRQVTISRANGHLTFPTSFICVAAMNPCPCGYLGHPDKACKDTITQIAKYRSKISGPLWDRMDLFIDVPVQRFQDLKENSCENSTQVRERVKRARNRQKQRFGHSKTNAEMSVKDIDQWVHLDSDCYTLLKQVVDDLNLSTRAYHRILKVALTISDLEEKTLQLEHLMEALSFRQTEVTH